MARLLRVLSDRVKQELANWPLFLSLVFVDGVLLGHSHGLIYHRL